MQHAAAFAVFMLAFVFLTGLCGVLATSIEPDALTACSGFFMRWVTSGVEYSGIASAVITAVATTVFYGIGIAIIRRLAVAKERTRTGADKQAHDEEVKQLITKFIELQERYDTLVNEVHERESRGELPQTLTDLGATLERASDRVHAQVESFQTTMDVLAGSQDAVAKQAGQVTDIASATTAKMQESTEALYAAVQEVLRAASGDLEAKNAVEIHVVSNVAASDSAVLDGESLCDAAVEVAVVSRHMKSDDAGREDLDLVAAVEQALRLLKNKAMSLHLFAALLWMAGRALSSAQCEYVDEGDTFMEVAERLVPALRALRNV